MVRTLVFHHVLGVTPGLQSFAAALEEAGHPARIPDLFEGATFPTIADGVAHAQTVGFDVILDRGVAAAEGIDGPFAVVGFSLGVLPAQKLAQTRSGVVGAVLCDGAVPSSEFGRDWPEGVALQVHLTEHDEWSEEDRPAAEDLVAEAGGELWIHPGSGHLAADPSAPDHDPEVAEAVLARTVAFLSGLD